MPGVETKNSLFKVYCNSYHGFLLRNLTNNNLEDYCIAWSKIKPYEDYIRFHTITITNYILMLVALTCGHVF